MYHKIAIDFGTTRTKIARLHNDKPCLINLGHEVTWAIPSLFYIPKSGDVLIGDEAQESLRSDPAGIVRGLKMDIHREAKIRRNGRKFERTELAATLFNWIREECDRQVFHSGKTKSCALTVPPAFDTYKIDKIKETAELGGFEQITTIEEPVAAAKYWLQSHAEDTGYVVVLDIGGGTSDIALVENRKEQCQIYSDLPPCGVPYGGNDIDDKIWDSLDVDDIPEKYFPGLLVKVRQAKETLTRRADLNKWVIKLSSKQIIISRQLVEECSRSFIERISLPLKQFARDAKRLRRLTITEIPLLLVGGGRNIPNIQESLTGIFGPVYVWEDSEQATVLGAGISEPVIPGRTDFEKYQEAIENVRPLTEDSVKKLEDVTKNLGLNQGTKATIETQFLGITIEIWKKARIKFKQAKGLWSKQDKTKSDFRKIIEICDIALEFDGTYPDPFYLKSMACEALYEKTEALSAITGFIGLVPNCRDAFFKRGRIQMTNPQLRTIKLAYEDFTVALRKENNGAIQELEPPCTESSIYLFRSYTSFVLKEFGQSLSDLQQARKKAKMSHGGIALLQAIMARLLSIIDERGRSESYRLACEELSKCDGDSFSKQILKRFPVWLNWFDGVNSLNDMIDWIRFEVLEALKPESSHGFSSIKEYIRITQSLRSPPWLMSSGALINNDNEFLLKMASVLADNQDISGAEKCLRQLWNEDPGYPFVKVVGEEPIQKILLGSRLRPIIKTKFRDTFFGNKLEILNSSPYPVTNVSIRLYVSMGNRSNQEDLKIDHTVPVLKRGEMADLSRILPRTRIRNVRISSRCDESRYFVEDGQ